MEDEGDAEGSDGHHMHGAAEDHLHDADADADGDPDDYGEPCSPARCGLCIVWTHCSPTHPFSPLIFARLLISKAMFMMTLKLKGRWGMIISMRWTRITMTMMHPRMTGASLLVSTASETHRLSIPS